MGQAWGDVEAGARARGGFASEGKEQWDRRTQLSSPLLVSMSEGINWLLTLQDDPLHLKKFCIFRPQLQV